jgi:oxidoreductase
MPFTAAVYGASGACGASIVAALCASPDWDRVLAVGRTPPPPPPSGADKLTPVPADLAALASPAPLAGVDAVFCALGTTRATAGSAAAFLAVDADGPAAVARAAAAAGVPFLSLVSSAGARRGGAAAPTSRLLHGALYVAAKGRAEDAVAASGVRAWSLLRPGLLDRGDRARGLEKAMGVVLKGLPVADLAAAAVADAVDALKSGRTGERVITDGEMRAAAKGRGG